MMIFEKLLQILHRKLSGKTIKIEWYMSNETRWVIIQSASNFGQSYLRIDKTDGSGAVGFVKLAAEQPVRGEFEGVVNKFIETIYERALEDEWRFDTYFWPAIFTRLDAYMKVDGVAKIDRVYIISELKQKARLLRVLRNVGG